MKTNTHIKAIEPELLENLVRCIDRLLADIEPYITPLTPQERQTLPKMGEKTLAFVEKSYEFALSNPILVPKYLDMDEFGVDYTDARGLYNAVNKARQFLDNLADTQMAAGSEAFQNALMFYHSAKAGAENNIPGAKAVYEELRKRFPGHGRRKIIGEESPATGGDLQE